MKRLLKAFGSGCLVLALVPAVQAQTNDQLQQEIEALKKGQDQIRKDLAEIKRLVEARPAAAAARPSGPAVEGKVFNLGDNPVRGASTASLTLVEFTDYQ